jgi:hypothetical protein
MSNRFDWRYAFMGLDAALNREQRRLVCQAIDDWNNDWCYDCDDYLIYRVENEDGDGIWDSDYEDSHDINQYFDNSFLQYMDLKFLGKARPKKPVFVGKATKLPLPDSGQSPNGNTLTHSGRDISSSSF